MTDSIVATLAILFLSLPLHAQDPGRSTTERVVILIEDGTSSLDMPSPFQGVTRRQLLVAQLGPVFKALRNQQNVRLIVLRLCGGTSLLFEDRVSQKDLGELKIVAGLLPCPEQNGTNIVEALKAIKGIIDGQRSTQYLVLFCTDGLHEKKDSPQEDAFEALKELGKHLKGGQVRLFAMLGTDDSVRLGWRNAANDAFGGSIPIYVSGYSDLVSTMKEVRAALEQ